MELFKLEAGASIVHVPYQGLAGALTGLMGGHVQVMLSNPVSYTTCTVSLPAAMCSFCANCIENNYCP